MGRFRRSDNAFCLGKLDCGVERLDLPGSHGFDVAVVVEGTYMGGHAVVT